MQQPADAGLQVRGMTRENRTNSQFAMSMASLKTILSDDPNDTPALPQGIVAEGGAPLQIADQDEEGDLM